MVSTKPTTPTKAAAPSAAALIRSTLLELVADATAKNARQDRPIKGLPLVLSAFPEKTGPKGGVKPVGVGVCISTPGKRDIGFYTKKSAEGILDTMGAPKDTKFAKTFITAATVVEEVGASLRPAKKSATKTAEPINLDE
jgi:hypothetical protein